MESLFDDLIGFLYGPNHHADPEAATFPHGPAPHAPQDAEPGMFDDGWFHLNLVPRLLPDFSDGSVINGDPHEDREWWNWQGEAPSCAVVAQQGVIESVLHRNVNQDELLHYAQEHGWYDPQTGTPTDCVGNLLEAFDIPIERHYDWTLEDLHKVLERGDKVIVGLNAQDVWDPQHDAAGLPIPQPDAGHAVWVTGMEFKGDQLYVVLNDSAPQTGWQEEVPVNDFINAWNQHGHFAVVTHLHDAA